MRRRRPPRLRFIPPGQLEGRPHVVCDGAPMPGTVLTLSHWPATPTPASLAGDLSCEIVFSYLSKPRYWRHDALWATNDHFDEDGLAGLFALCDPERAASLHNELVEFARAGDFAVASSMKAAQAVFAVQALVAEHGIDGAAREHDKQQGNVGDLYQELLGRLPEVLEHPERLSPRLEEEQEAMCATSAAINKSIIKIDFDESGQFAVVEVPAEFDFPSALPLLGAVRLSLHPFALHRVITAARVLVCQAGHYCYYDRYETWVRYRSAILPKRRDLVPLASELSAAESLGCTWRADPPGTLIASMQTVGENASSLSVREVRARLASYLRRAPTAWDPFSLVSPQGA